MIKEIRKTYKSFYLKTVLPAFKILSEWFIMSTFYANLAKFKENKSKPINVHEPNTALFVFVGGLFANWYLHFVWFGIKARFMAFRD